MTTPLRARKGWKISRCVNWRNPRFQRRPQKSLNDAAERGACMIGRASTPADRQRSDRMWKVPKCKTNMIPSMPTQPASNSLPAGTRRVMPQMISAPKLVLAIAQNHSFPCGLRVWFSGSRNATASMPGQAKRNPTLRLIVVLKLIRHSHQACHLQPKKIAAARVHMKHHGARDV